MPYITTTEMNFNPANYPLTVSTVPTGGPAIFNSPLDLAKRIWSAMNGGKVPDDLANHLSANTLAHPQFISSGVNSHLLFEWAHPADLIEVNGAYSTQAALYADLSPLIGTRVNCTDPDPLKRGVYNRTEGGTGWTKETSNIKDKAWVDYNHPQRLLELLFQSWIYSSTPKPFQGNPFFYGGPSGDWRGARITFDMQVRDLWLGPWAKIGQHIQAPIPRLSEALTQAFPGAPNPKFLLPNFMKTDQLISDQLGFGRNSWGKPNDVPVVRDSGRRLIVVDYDDDDSKWECFGDPGRDPSNRMINYGSGPVGEVLENLHNGNSFTLVHHWTPNDGERWWNGNNSSASIPDFDRVRGKIMLYGVKVEIPV